MSNLIEEHMVYKVFNWLILDFWEVELQSICESFLLPSIIIIKSIKR